MRAPGLQVVPNALPSGGAVTVKVAKQTGFDALQQGAAAVGQAADKIQAGYEKEQREAAVVEARDALTAYQHDTTDTLHGSSTVTPGAAADAAFAGRDARTGFMSTRGKAAAESSADTLDELEEKRQKRAGKIANEKARELFLQSSAESYEHTRRSIESHVSSEIERAKVDSIAAAADEATRSTALDPNNDQLAAERISSVHAALGNLGRGEEFTSTETMKVQQKVAAARLDALLSAGDIANADRVFGVNERALGTAADTYRNAIGKAKAAGAADATASRIVAVATNDRGDIDQARALKALNELPPAEQQKVRPVLFQRMTEQEQAYAADTKRISTAAFSVYNRQGWAKFSGTQLAQDLNDRNPELYNRLENDARVEWERLERKKRGTAEDRKWQSDRDEIAKNTFMAMTPEQRKDTDLDEWVKGRGLSDVGKSDLGPLKEAARSVVEKGQAAGETEFVNRAKADAEAGFTVGDSKAAKDARKHEERIVEAKARQWFSQWLVQHEGKPPTDEDIAKASSAISIDQLKHLPPDAAKAAKDTVRMGGGKVQVMPGLDLTDPGTPDIPGTQPSRLDRAKQLKAEGKTLEQAKLILKDEGY